MNSLSETCRTVLMISGNFSLAVIWKYDPVASSHTSPIIMLISLLKRRYTLSLRRLKQLKAFWEAALLHKQFTLGGLDKLNSNWDIPLSLFKTSTVMHPSTYLPNSIYMIIVSKLLVMISCIILPSCKSYTMTHLPLPTYSIYLWIRQEWMGSLNVYDIILLR